MRLFPVIGLCTASSQLEKRGVFAGTRIAHISSGHLPYLDRGGNSLLGDAAEIFNIESLNISVAVQLGQQAKNCSEKHRILKQGEKTKQFSTPPPLSP